MEKCHEPQCKFKCKRPQDMKRHWTIKHSIKSPIQYEERKKRKYTKRSKLTLADAIIALRVKRDSFDEVINLLEELG